jgi:hypothetical protein
VKRNFSLRHLRDRLIYFSYFKRIHGPFEKSAKADNLKFYVITFVAHGLISVIDDCRWLINDGGR